ncbi:CNH domain containing protein, partial [Asbolus verrucosus]
LQTLFIEDLDRYNVDSILTVPQDVYVNCLLDVTKNIKVLGTDQGIYSFYNECLLHIEGLTEIYRICVLPELSVVVMIAGKNSVLVYCDLNHLVNLTQCAPCSKPVLKHKNIAVKNLDGFHFLQASSVAHHHTLCAATSKQVVIIKYDLDSDDFAPLRIMDTAEPVGCALFTEHTLIVGADKFFEIDLSKFTAEEFLDSSDVRLKHAVKFHKMRSFPLAILQIFNNPKEYLLCFNECPVFVDEYGRSSRTTEIKSSHLPLGFQFIRPYLYVIQFSGVEIFKLNENVLRSENSCEQIPSVSVEFTKVRYLGHNKRGIYIFHDGKVKFLEGKKLVFSDDCSSVSQFTDGDESDRFSFTSSIVQSLDGNSSDVENSSVEDVSAKKVQFSQTNFCT